MNSRLEEGKQTKNNPKKTPGGPLEYLAWPLAAPGSSVLLVLGSWGARFTAG